MLGGIAAVFVGLLLFAVIGEVGLRVLGYGAIFDVHSKPSIFWIHDDLLGWRHEPNAKGVYVGPRPWPVEFDAEVRINSLGLRGPEVEDVPPGGYRVLVIGDSLTAAFEVSYPQTFTALLEGKLSQALGTPTQVVNAGVRGYGTDQSYLYYRERGRLLRPDLVVHINAANDARNNIELHRMRRPFGKGAFKVDGDGRLKLVGTPVAKYAMCSAYRLTSDFVVRQFASWPKRMACWAQTKLFDHSALFTFTSLMLQQYPQLLSMLYRMGDMAVENAKLLREEDYMHRLTSRLILELANEVRKDGADFLLVGEGGPLSRLDLESFERAGIRVVEFDPIYGDDPEEVRFHHDGHWNALGHERVANLLAPVLAEELAARRSARGDHRADRTSRLD